VVPLAGASDTLKRRQALPKNTPERF